jgi:hypothetical protein
VNGKVDRADRAIVELSVRSTIDAARLKLSQSSAVMAGLADGKQVVLDTFTCFVEWFGELKQVEVVESECQCALLGTGLLRECRVEIDYPLRTVSIS